MRVSFISLFLAIFFSLARPLFAQPIPIELMAGNKFMSFDLSFSKSFFENSKLGFFHMNTLQVDYDERANNSFILQDLLTCKVVKNLKIVGGAFYGMPGFNPTLGLQYNIVSKSTFFLFAPRINIITEPSYDFMTIFQYKLQLNEKAILVTRLKMLNIFDANSHIKSYQWFRLGLETNGIQFGLAADFNENGPQPKVETNFGVFIRKEIF